MAEVDVIVAATGVIQDEVDARVLVNVRGFIVSAFVCVQSISLRSEVCINHLFHYNMEASKRQPSGEF